MKKSLKKNTLSFLLSFVLILVIFEAGIVAAQYIPDHSLTINVNNFNGGTTSPTPGVYLIGNGISFQVTAKPAVGYVFNGWYLNGIYQHNLTSISVHMLNDNTLMAAFSQDAVALTITTQPPVGGTTNPPPGTSFYQYGSDVLVTASPTPDYFFDGWYLDGAYIGTQTSVYVDMVTNHELSAYFASKTDDPIEPEDPEPEEPEQPELPPATIDLTCESYSTYSNFNVKVNGILTGDDSSIANSGVLLYVSVTGGQTWDVLSFVNTDTNGEFSVSWKPSVTGVFLINATWNGNSEFSETSEVVNFAVAPFEEESVFSVSSNSTLSGLVFNSENNELGFSATGPSGTIGNTKVVIPKSLISDLSNLTVNIDGTQTSYESESQTDSWLIAFTYSHSSHQIVLNLNSQTIPEEPETPVEPDSNEESNDIVIPFEVLLVAVVVAAIVIVAIVGYKLGTRKRA